METTPILNNGGKAVPDGVEDGGRTYHTYKAGTYLMPNDTEEQDRLDLQHKMTGLIFRGRLSLVPFPKPPANVLDVATGSGIWAIEFAEQHPSSRVTAIDIGNIYPSRPPPANCTFISCIDAEDPWTFLPPRGTLDYIHLRYVTTCFNSPPAVIRQAFDHLAPGGWIEFQDSDLSLRCENDSLAGTALERWSRVSVEGARNVGRDILVTRRYKDWLVEAGFVDVHEEEVNRPSMPVSAWPETQEHRAIGAMARVTIGNGIAGAGKYGRLAGLSGDEVRRLTERVMEDLGNPEIRAYYAVYCVYGRKP
ncbi:S-adenosyl-L-methionine-dependent methyltransferase [Madurella fahalii]|uniref:S-adenosyl-L-methionine-dependent methyltransferase n=1 Tax=Madurella fahalii TaxID=1157608 RepID=A0ABQ0G525_9PEZI